MKKLMISGFLFLRLQGFSQTGQNGDIVFNSVVKSEEKVKDFVLISSYYTLKNNIENKGSSVYISDHPTLSQVSNAATELPAEFFLISKGKSIVSMIIMVNQPHKKFLVINPTTGKQSEYDCHLTGDITQNRADEIIKENYDLLSKINGRVLYFNNQRYKIISNKEIKEKVLEIVEKKKLSNSDSSSIKILSSEDLRTFVLTQTESGGELDFFTSIKGKEYEVVEIRPGVISTNISTALYKWGRANYELGVNQVDDALSIFSEFKGRPLNQREKDCIGAGFRKEDEK